MMDVIVEHAKNEHPNESCGFMLSNGEYFPCQNIANDPSKHVVWSPDDWILAEQIGDVVALVHSHPDGELILSEADRQAQKQTGLPWFLAVATAVAKFPCVPPLLGRKFKHGEMDCYSLFRDAYALAGMSLPDFTRADDWWLNGENLYLDNLPKSGFGKVTEPQPGDVFIIQLASNTPNHAAIYLGQQRILHHCPERLSSRDVYGGYWAKHTHSIWRHKQWPSYGFMGICNDLAAFSN